jgi:hypothetical protein
VKRRLHAAKNNLDWIVRLVWLPEAIRPIGVRQIYSGSVGVGASRAGGFGVLLSPLISLVVGVPTMLVVLPLRFAGVLSWEVEAIARPWGRGGPATIMRWRVKGWSEARRVIDEVAGQLEAGETQPRVEGAQREK